MRTRTIERKKTTKEMLRDINSMISRAELLLDNKPKYSTVLKHLIQINNENDESIKTMKQLSDQIGCSLDKFRKSVELIYNDLCDFEIMESNSFNFPALEIQFCLEGLYSPMTFFTNNLPFIPRKGETIMVPYFRAVTGTDFYHVSDISHHLSDEKQSVILFLNTGPYSSYWDIRRSLAIDTYELSWKDREMSDYEQKEMLNIKLHPWG